MAPPVVALLFVKVEFEIIRLSALSTEQIAPPSSFATLFVNMQFIIAELGSCTQRAPPNFAELFVNMQFEMVFSSPVMKAPPLSALLFIKVQFIMVHFLLVTRAPPVGALLFMKVQFDMMELSPTICIAPPNSLAELSINLQFEITIFSPLE